MNPDLQARYAANRLRVVRQCRTGHDDIIDLVLFLNGIPVATAELKTDFTQDMNAAVDQYRFDRIPKPKGRPFAEPLLDFPRGALVHFAVSNRTVMMATRLAGPPRAFCPSTRATMAARVTRPTPQATARPTCGSRCGSATAGWRFWAATSSPSETARRR
jgi:type I restriction enzyme R subunit